MLKNSQLAQPQRRHHSDHTARPPGHPPSFGPRIRARNRVISRDALARGGRVKPRNLIRGDLPLGHKKSLVCPVLCGVVIMLVTLAGPTRNCPVPTRRRSPAPAKTHPARQPAAACLTTTTAAGTRRRQLKIVSPFLPHIYPSLM